MSLKKIINNIFNRDHITEQKTASDRSGVENQELQGKLYRGLDAIKSKLIRNSDELSKRLTERLDKRLDELESEVKKLARMEYRTGRAQAARLEAMTDKTEQLTADMTGIKEWHLSQEKLKKAHEQAARDLITLLDELDRVRSGLDRHKNPWAQILDRWADDMLQILAALGIYELQLLGTTFDPTCARALESVNAGCATRESDSSSDPEYAPFEIVEVVKRGFATQDGAVYRKAEVITVEGDEELEPGTR